LAIAIRTRQNYNPKKKKKLRFDFFVFFFFSSSLGSADCFVMPFSLSLSPWKFVFFSNKDATISFFPTKEKLMRQWILLSLDTPNELNPKHVRH